ncbi:MAG: RluA family pseudouridine synthase [bacterium]|nr:RluA family pseudouridine synthase [Deltaproteobacteria bacterium]MCP4904968.1 RluA family pseudouridine synthase [bacterium]
MTDDEQSPPSSLTRVGRARRALVFSVEEPGVGTRVDTLLAELSGVSRAQIRRWIDAGRVRVSDERVRASYKVALGETIEARPLEPIEMDLRPEPIELVVLHEDEDLIVLDKPAGLVVHPAPGHPKGTLVNGLLHHCGDLAGIGGVLRPGIVHRLDRGTSGVLVAAKNDVAHQHLSRQFAEHSIDRIYRTLVRGVPRADEGRIDRPVGRHPRDRKRMSVETKAGRPSVTNWKVLRRFREVGTSELEIRPETGRTHQIRVHLSSAGLPLVGDVVYGRARGRDAVLGRPALHAERLGFEHPRSGRRMHFDAALPDDLMELMAGFGPAERPPSRTGSAAT